MRTLVSSDQESPKKIGKELKDVMKLERKKVGTNDDHELSLITA